MMMYGTLRQALFALYGLFLLSFLVLHGFYDVFGFLIVLVGLIGLIGLIGLYPLFKERPHLSRFEWLFLAALVGYPLVSVMSVITIGPITDSVLARNERYLPLMLVVPAYLLMRRMHYSAFWLAAAFAIAAIVAGMVALIQYWYLEVHNTWVLMHESVSPRKSPSGNANPMRFGALMLAFAVICLNGLLFLQKKPKVLTALLAVGALLALIGCLLAQNRASWLAMPVVAFLYLVYFYWKGHRRMALAVLAGSIVIGAGLAQTPQFERRWAAAADNVERYFEGDSQTSIGARIDMWKVSAGMFREKPFFGHGIDSYREFAPEFRAANEGISRTAGNVRNPHNEFLHTLVERGLIGMVALIALLLVPFMGFVRQLKNDNTLFFAISGVMVIAIYGVVGQSSALFVHPHFLWFYALTIPMLISQIVVRQSTSIE